jgi:NTE family protein
MDADLVFEGEGVKGIGLVGAYSALRAADYTVHRIAGSSAGAIVGALIAAGMEPKELEIVMRTIDYGRFQDEGFLDHLGNVGKGLSILFEKGSYEGRYLHEWLDGLLTTLGKRTFGDLRIDDPNSPLPPEKAYGLVVMTSDVNRGVLVRLPWDYARFSLKAGDQVVADAVRASMSIPIFCEPVRFTSRDEGGKEARSFMVDAEMLSNFPIGVFDRTDGKPPRWPTFGSKLSARPHANQQRFKVKGTLGLARAMVGRMTNFPRPDAHRRPLGPRAHDVRRHRHGESDRLRPRRTHADVLFEKGRRGGWEVPGRMGLRRVHRRVPRRRRERRRAMTTIRSMASTRPETDRVERDRTAA